MIEVSNWIFADKEVMLQSVPNVNAMFRAPDGSFLSREKRARSTRSRANRAAVLS